MQIRCIDAAALAALVATAASHAGSPVFTPHVVAPNTFGEIATGDIDGDGDTDIVCAFGGAGVLRWYENTPGPTGPVFVSHDAVTGFAGIVNVQVFDMDGDGDPDLLSASGSDDLLQWHENVAGPGGLPSFVTHLVAIEDAVTEVAAGDLDGDGDVDVVSGSAGLDNVAWHERVDGPGEPVFVRHLIFDGNLSLIQDVHVADVDGDGDLDVLSASDIDDRVAWYENQPDGAGSISFTERIVTTDPDGQFNGEEGFADGAHGIHAADMDGDGDVDVLSASVYNGRIGWHEQVVGPGGIEFVDHSITLTPPGAFSVTAADMDNDGDRDVLSASSFIVAWHENVAAPGSGQLTFVTHTITTDTGTTIRALAADFDGDGDNDAVAVSGSLVTGITWYEQAGVPCTGDLNGDGVVGGADLAILLGQWGAVQTPGAPADLDGNSIIDGADLAILLGAWGAC